MGQNTGQNKGKSTGKRLGYAQPATRETVGMEAYPAGGRIDTSKLLLTVDDVAHILSVNKFTVYRMAQEKEIGSVKRGTSLRFPRVIVEQYVARLMREQGVEVDA